MVILTMTCRMVILTMALHGRDAHATVILTMF